MHYTSRFDESFGQLSHYQRYPRMRPFVGVKYGHSLPKILLVAESHYLPAGRTIHLDPQLWYQGGESDLRADDGPGWIHTRAILDKNAGRWQKKGHTIYRNLEQALVEAGVPGEPTPLEYVAFMNGFQRPARERLSLDVSELDRRMARETLIGVVRAIQPDRVIFVSRKAAGALGSSLEIGYDSVPHPASAWWNRPSKRGTGKRQFVRAVARVLQTTES